MTRLTLVLACLSAWMIADVAQAQVTINGGVGWSGGYDIGGSTAQLRTNAPGSTTPPFRLFDVDSRMSPSPGGEVRVGVALPRDFTLEGGVLFARRRLAFRISGDPETTAQQLGGETLQHYVFDAGLLWELPLRRATRVRMFAGGGAGFLRQLHQDRTLVETGEIYYAGGGARYWLRGLPDSSRSLGLRGDVRFNLRRNGIDFDDRMRMYPTVSVLMFLVL
jgi:hypothetical protein